MEKIAGLDMIGLLLSIQELYRDLLLEKLSLSELIKNKTFCLKKKISFEEMLRATVKVEEAFYALRQNVNKEYILWWLLKELP